MADITPITSQECEVGRFGRCPSTFGTTRTSWVATVSPTTPATPATPVRGVCGQPRGKMEEPLLFEQRVLAQ